MYLGGEFTVATHDNRYEASVVVRRWLGERCASISRGDDGHYAAQTVIGKLWSEFSLGGIERLGVSIGIALDSEQSASGKGVSRSKKFTIEMIENKDGSFWKGLRQEGREEKRVQ